MQSDRPRPKARLIVAGAAVLALVAAAGVAFVLTRSDDGAGGGALWGANYSDLTSVDESIYDGRAEVARIYFQELPGVRWSADGAVREATADGIRTFVVSWKERDPDTVRAFLATIPDGLTVYASFHHEPENDAGQAGSVAYQAWNAEWKQVWAEQSPIIRDAGFVPTSILMSYTLGPDSGRSISDWLLPPGTVDVFAFDGYLTGQDPAELVDRITAAVKASGVDRTGLAETGSSVTDPHRADELRTLKADIEKAGNFEWALYWNSSEPGYDGRLDAATADAWFG